MGPIKVNHFKGNQLDHQGWTWSPAASKVSNSGKTRERKVLLEEKRFIEGRVKVPPVNFGLILFLPVRKEVQFDVRITAAWDIVFCRKVLCLKDLEYNPRDFKTSKCGVYKANPGKEEAKGKGRLKYWTTLSVYYAFRKWCKSLVLIGFRFGSWIPTPFHQSSFHHTTKVSKLQKEKLQLSHYPFLPMSAKRVLGLHKHYFILTCSANYNPKLISPYYSFGRNQDVEDILNQYIFSISATTNCHV